MVENIKTYPYLFPVRLHQYPYVQVNGLNFLLTLQVLTPPSTSYLPSTSPSSPSYLSANSSSNMSNACDSTSSGTYGQNQQTYPRTQPFSRQQSTLMSPSLAGMRQMPADTGTRNIFQSSRVSFIGQVGKPDLFSSTSNTFQKASASFLPSVRFNNSSTSGLLRRNLNKDEMM